MTVRHEPIEHTADTGFRVFAPTVEELFEESAVALFHVMYPQPAATPTSSFSVASTGGSFSELLVAWLSDLLWLSESEHLAVSEIIVDELTLSEVRGRVSGVDLGMVELHGPPVKAVTYHGLEISNDSGWQATVILDV